MPFTQSLAALVLASITLTTFAQEQPAVRTAGQDQGGVAASPPPRALSAELRRTVTYIDVFYDKTDPDHPKGVIGTGFFVVYEDKRLGEKRGFAYLVTNRHVAQPGIESGTPHNALEVWLRVNYKVPQGNEQSVTAKIPMNGVTHWYFSDDEAVDLAVMPFIPDENVYDLEKIPVSMFATSDKIKARSINVGDPVVFTGFFSNFSGKRRVEPIFRQGVIAMMPEEKFETTLKKPGNLYLADAHAFHGNSGSPIFVSMGGAHRGSLVLGEEYLLIGIISGYYPEQDSFVIPGAAVLTGEVRDNSGIATVVPADELLKLLDSPSLVASRNDIVKREQQRLKP